MNENPAVSASKGKFLCKFHAISVKLEIGGGR